MNKKILTMIAGSVLASVLLAGCGVNNRNQEPPPENEVNEPGVNNNEVDRNEDLLRDNNTPREDMNEDRLEREENDNRR